MKNQKYHNVGTIPKSNIKIVDRGKMDSSIIHKYMTVTLPAWYRHFNKEWQGYTRRITVDLMKRLGMRLLVL
jgi:hypothetical protein